jgi:outer membrane immunogenic protein
MISNFTRSLAIAVCIATIFVTWPKHSFAQSNDEVLRRVEAKLDALERENAALRKRVRRLEKAKTSVAASNPASLPSQQKETQGEPVMQRAGSETASWTGVSDPVSWTGFYVGGSAGYGWGSPTTITSNDNRSTGNGGISVFVPLNPGQYTPNVSGVMAGVQAGYDYQIGRTVLGVVSDFSWANIKGDAGNTAVCGGFQAGAPFCTYTQSQKLDWFGTVRGRFGFVLVPDTMVYGTGGLAFGHAVVSQSLFSSGFVGTFSAAATTSDTRTGWVIGGGIESMITPNWTVGLEYLHYDLGTITSVAPISGPGPATTAAAKYQINGELARASLTYKFH